MSDLVKASEADLLPLDLSIPGARQMLAKQILADIDDYCVRTYDNELRKHLGASLIGNPCSRHLYYSFRWFKKEQFSGRMMRLFNRGHREEDRFAEWLRGIGFQVWTVADDGKQFRVKGCFGHFGGSLDGINKAPARYKLDEPMLCEFKTSGTGSSFTELQKKGVALAKPQHFAQMSVYGKGYGFKYAVYCCINKNDDDLYIEIVKLDWQLAEMQERKGQDVITSRIPPAKFSMNAATYECKYCNFAGICHRNEAPERNCRSCEKSTPVENGQWFCAEYSNVIPQDFIPKGCNQWARND